MPCRPIGRHCERRNWSSCPVATARRDSLQTVILQGVELASSYGVVGVRHCYRLDAAQFYSFPGTFVSSHSGKKRPRQGDLSNRQGERPGSNTGGNGAACAI
jgi:hypothetical protein